MIDLDKVKDYSVLFVGDDIVDEYVYVRTIGKAVKENALSAQFVTKEVFEGGVSAASNHLRTFCAQVDIMRGPNTMFNSRMVDEVYLRKLFVTHRLSAHFEYQKPVKVESYDLVVVTDFGHGTMTKALIERLTKEAKYLVVNAQTNATNYGFNLITKYPRADLVVLDELEARLAVHDRDSDMEDVITALGFDRIIVTMGIRGAVGFDGAFEQQAALTDKVLDNMGAGDAFLSVVAPFAAAGAPMKDLVRIGNAAGAIKCGIIGHRSSVTKETLGKYLNG